MDLNQLAANLSKPTNAVRFLKADGDGGEATPSRVGGYLVMWGSPEKRDLYGEYFTPETYLALDWPMQARPMFYQHGLDGTIRTHLIGAIDTLKTDDIGLWAEAQMQLHFEYIDQLRWLIEQGYIAWSSGALPYQVHVDSDGQIKRWPIVEGSLTPTPAEPRMFGVGGAMLIRAVQGGYVHTCTLETAQRAYKSLSLPMSSLLKPGDATEGAPAEGQDGGGSSSIRNNQSPQGESDMDPEQIKQMIADGVAATLKAKEDEAEQARIKAAAEEAERLRKENEDLKGKLAERQQPARRLPGRTGEVEIGGDSPRIQVGSRFDSLKALDMAHIYLMLKQHGGVSDSFSRAFAEKVVAEGKSGAMKANELDHSTQTGYGDEWVPDLWSSELWLQARQDNVVLQLFRQIEMPSNPYEVPLEGTDPTVYYTAETTDEDDLTLAASTHPVPDSKIGTGKVTLTAKKLSLRVGFSSELVEDALVPVAQQFRTQAVRAMADAIDHVLLNGDTTTTATGNINSDDSTPATGAKYLAFDGLRHLALVTTTANAVDAAGSPTLALMRATRATMAAKYAYNPKNLAWIVDFSTYVKLLSLDEFITMDKMGPQATAMTGQLGVLDGIPVLVSAEAPMTEADGKMSATPGNNTKGQATLVYTPGWLVGYRRRIVATTKYFEEYDAYQMFAHVRIAFINQTTDVAAVLYDITV